MKNSPYPSFFTLCLYRAYAPAKAVIKAHTSAPSPIGASQVQGLHVQPSSKLHPHISQISSPSSSTQCPQSGFGSPCPGLTSRFIWPLRVYISAVVRPPPIAEADVCMPVIGCPVCTVVAIAISRLVECIVATGACAKPLLPTEWNRAVLVVYTPRPEP